MKTILISGASVAGNALAYWLQRYGFEVSVVERAPVPREGGYAVDVRGPAIDVLARTGVEADVRALNCDTLGTSILDTSGRSVTTLPRGFGVIAETDIEIMRGDLVRVLYDATHPWVNYRFGDSITAIEARANDLQVHFDHAPPRSFDLVIGADGLHSNVRRLCFGAESDFILHLGSYMAIFGAPNHLELDRWQVVMNQPGRVISAKSTTGNSELKVTVFFASPKLEYDYRDIATQQQLTAAAFANSGWELPQLMRAMPEAADFYFDSTSQVQMPSWSRGRVSLVGDAAYCPSPLSGQGSSMALVGAYVLAGELAAAGGDHEAGFAGYERCMRDFVEKNQQYARALVNGFAPKTEFGIWARNKSMAWLRFVPGSRQLLQFAMRGLANAANDIRFADYTRYERPESTLRVASEPVRERRAAIGR